MFNINEYSHMPFIAYDGNGKPKQFCCLKINDKWKLHHFEDGIWKRLYTGLPEDATECSPTAEWTIDGWRISFIGGGSNEDLNYFLYEKYGLDDSAPLLVIPAKLGFLWKYRLVFADPKSSIVIYDDSTRYIMTLSEEIEWLYRVSYSPTCPNLLLISGQKKNGEIFSIAHNTGMDKCFELITDGVPAYKAAVFEDKVFYATKLPNEDFEDRRIVQATTIEWKEVPNNLYITDIIMGENKDYHNEEFEL